MSATSSELLDSYTKMLDSEFYKNLKGITAGIEALQKSLVGSDLHKQMQAWQTVLNDPESSINKSMHMWSEFSRNIDYGKLTGLQAGLQQFADQMTNLDTSALSSLKTEQLFDTNTEIGKNFTEVYDCAYETAKEIEKPDIGKEELKNNIIEEIDNKDDDKSTIRNSEFQKAVFNIICFILVTTFIYLYQIGKIEHSSANDFINCIMTICGAPLLVNNLPESFKTINKGIGKNDEQ